jgi:tetratricopeptide (TPR) repeat protein
MGLGLAATVMAPGWPDRVAPHLRAARVAVSQGRLDDAGAELAKAQGQGEPPNAVTGLWGVIYARAGRPDDALPLLRRAWEAAGEEGRTTDPDVAEALARILMQRFELAEALPVLDRWARAAPTDPRPLVMRAEIDRRMGVDRVTIMAAFREALRRDPKCDQARLGLADLLNVDAKFAESEQEYAAYAARRPDDPRGHVGIGITERALGDVDRAASALDKALALDPDDTLALKERAAIDLRDGHHELALRRLDRAVAADPFDPELRYQRSLALARLGRRGEADAERVRSDQLRREHLEMSQISEQLTDHPTDNTWRYRAARWMIDHGRGEEAAQWARMILRDQPGHPEANRLLAEYHRRRGDLGLANFYQLHVAHPPTPEGAGTGTDHEPGSPSPPQVPPGR